MGTAVLGLGVVKGVGAGEKFITTETQSAKLSMGTAPFIGPGAKSATIVIAQNSGLDGNFTRVSKRTVLQFRLSCAWPPSHIG